MTFNSTYIFSHIYPDFRLKQDTYGNQLSSSLVLINNIFILENMQFTVLSSAKQQTDHKCNLNGACRSYSIVK
mgnify:CR=1 FL=1